MRLERLLARLRALAPPAARDRLRTTWTFVRHHPDAALAAVLLAGVAAMIIHWS